MPRRSPLKQNLIGNNSNKQATEDSTTATRGTGCCSGFCAEFSKSTEFFGQVDTNGQQLDLEASFGGGKEYSGNYWMSLAKFVFWGITTYTYAVGWLRSRPDVDFFLAYLTNWALTYAVIYMTLSLLISWCSASLPLIKAAWIMYSVAAVHQVAVTILFWALEFDPEHNTVGYYTVMSHGGVACLVLLEGNLINRVPVRLKHYLFNFLSAALYIGWTLIQTLVLAYNPNTDEDDDVAIYNVIQWKNDPLMAAIISASILFVFMPLDQLFVWALSLCRRRYQPDSLRQKAYMFGQTTPPKAPKRNRHHHGPVAV